MKRLWHTQIRTPSKTSLFLECCFSFLDNLSSYYFNPSCTSLLITTIYKNSIYIHSTSTIYKYHYYRLEKQSLIIYPDQAICTWYYSNLFSNQPANLSTPPPHYFPFWLWTIPNRRDKRKQKKGKKKNALYHDYSNYLTFVDYAIIWYDIMIWLIYDMD